MLSSSQLGQTGPLATMRGTGIQLAAYAGFNHLTGWEDREPSVLYGGFSDCPGARFGAVALIAALLYRRRTGKGMHIDLSQYEAGIQLLSPALMDYQVNKRVAMRKGNRHDLLHLTASIPVVAMIVGAPLLSLPMSSGRGCAGAWIIRSGQRKRDSPHFLKGKRMKMHLII